MDVNAQDSRNQSTALHVAISHGHIDIVKSLLGANANPNIVSALGDSPLSMATQRGHTPIASLLQCKTTHPELSSTVTSTDKSVPGAHTDESMLETEPEKPVDVYQTLDYQRTQKRGSLIQFLVYSLSHPLHTFRKKESHYIYDAIGAHETQSEQTHYQSVESFNTGSTPEQHSMKSCSQLLPREKVKPMTRLMKPMKSFLLKPAFKQ